MTTAARPTFDPAKGRATIDLTYQSSAKDLPSHTKLKTRQPGQGGEQEYTVEDLKAELREAERKHFEAKRRGQDGEAIAEDEQADLEREKMKYIEMAQRLDAESDESDDGEGHGGSSGSEDSEDDSGGDSSDEDSEDETAMLMRELEKIKRERAEEKAREEREAMELGEEPSGSLLGDNPLLGKRNFSVKRRWDDDVVFRNQARGGDEKPKKRFVNDMLRSDFHRKFMRKYMH
ncbi:Cwf15/Cwc15 cell cycle control protein [Martensiomyces pterosporus]|nr:Cwf15/Cwc15 cell cycle control protein [Martensiomyces pterosporus]